MNDSLRRKSLFMTGSIAALLVLYVVVYWLPNRREIRRLHDDLVRLSAETVQHEQGGRRLAALHSELAQIDGYNRTLVKRLPATLSVPEFLATLHGVADDHGVTVSRVTPMPASELAGVPQQLVRLSLAGSFGGITRVLYELETIPQLIELTDLDAIRAAKLADSGNSLEVQLEVRLFARPTKSAAATKSSG